jgi:cytochrome P450
MILNPDVQRKVQIEIDAVVGGERRNSIPTVGDLGRMPYTCATVEEIFRLSHIAPMPVARKCMADFVYRGYLIHQGTAVFFNTAAVMMDKNYWGDPEVFRPERFLDSSGTKVVNTERNLPFGYGKRVCIAEQVARESVAIYLATFLKIYKFEIPPGKEAPSTEPLVSFTLRPHPFEALISPRE